jgi:hypothetical protein
VEAKFLHISWQILGALQAEYLQDPLNSLKDAQMKHVSFVRKNFLGRCSKNSHGEKMPNNFETPCSVQTWCYRDFVTPYL